MPVPALFGVYHPPRVRRGRVVFCLYRDADCRVTAWHRGPIPWPRCDRVGQMGGSGLWVNDDLRRAIRTESAAALMHWFGVSSKAVWRWRQAFGVGGTATTPGSAAAHRTASRLGADAVKAKDWTDDELDAKSEAAKRSGQRPGDRWAATGWTAEELALLGTMPDKTLAKNLGRTWSAVRSARVRRRVPAFAS